MPTTDECTTVSGFTELSEGSKARHGFDWQRDYAPVYRDCPTAFWLAPHAADLLPEADLVHPRPMPDEPVSAEQPIGAQRAHNRVLGASLAIFCAGPIFGMAISMASGTPGSALLSLALAPFTVPIGGILALVPVLVGTLALGKLGELGGAWRHPVTWMAVGAPFGMALAAGAQAPPVGMAVMAVVGAACAGLARIGVRWRGVPAHERFADAGRDYQP